MTADAAVPFAGIRSARLVLDLLRSTDIPAVVAVRDDPVVARFQGWPLPFTATDAEHLIAAPDTPLLAGVQLAIRTADGSVVGDAMVAPAPGLSHAFELGITIGSAHQGRGFATEAVRAIVAHLFSLPTVHKLIAYVAVPNAASLRVFDRAEFRREGVLRDNYRLRSGALVDEVLFGLTRVDWGRSARDFDVIAFDADDTLWQSEDSFTAAEKRFVEIVSPYVDTGIDVKAALTAVERKNVHVLGYGVKAFGLSMVETATSLAGDRIPATTVGHLIEIARAMLTEPVHLLPGVATVLADVGSTHRIVLITKGDLIHQSAKIEASGLAHHFSEIEIVMEKDAATYARIITRLGVPPSRFLMVGNSVPSDILPVLSLGGSAVHVPYHLLWDLEQAPVDHGRTFVELQALTQLPDWLRESTTARGE